MVIKTDYKPGQMLIYKENCPPLTPLQFKVRILEVKGDERYERYRLEILDGNGRLENGHVFECERLRQVEVKHGLHVPGFMCSGVWKLEEIVERN